MPTPPDRSTQETFRDLIEAYRRTYGALADHLAEFLAVREGSKLATQLTLHPRHDPDREGHTIDRLCTAAGLHWTRYIRNGQHKFLIGREPIPAPTSDDDNPENRFSYPSCCVEAYTADPREYYFLRHIGDLLAGDPSFAFAVNPFLVSTPLHVLSHYPCSLRCPKTLALAEHRLALIRTRVPKLHANLLSWNRAPAFFTDICGIGLLFRGTRTGTRIDYHDLWYVGVPRELARTSPSNTEADFLLFDALVASLQHGNALELDAEELTVLSGEKVQARFPRPAHLTWRVVEFL